LQRGLPDGQVLVPDRVQFFIGRVLKRDQGIVRAGQGQEDLVELALGRALVAGLGVLE
jgi:hypothetical protein